MSETTLQSWILSVASCNLTSVCRESIRRHFILWSMVTSLFIGAFTSTDTWLQFDVVSLWNS